MKKLKKKNRKKRVWHVTDFRELFELPDDLRKDRPGPLSYTKSFVTLTGYSREYEVKHFERLLNLKHRPERHLLRSIFEDIKNLSGKKTIRNRGFLLTTDEKPATYEYLAAQLKIDIAELKKAMPMLEEIGLVERVTMDALPTDGEVTKAAKGRRKGVETKRQKSKRRKNSGRKKCEAPDESGRIRTNPDESGRKRMGPAASGTKRTALYNGKRKRNTKIKVGNDKKEEEIKKRQKRIKQIIDDHRAGKIKTQTKSATTTPATAQSTLPRKSAEAEGHVIEFPAVPPLAVRNSCDSEKHRYADDCKDFAGEIFQALNLPFDPRSVKGRRECGCFASLWEKTKLSGMPSSALDEIRSRAIFEAGKISKRRGRCGNVSAVFCFVFARLVASRSVGARSGGCG